MNNTKRLIKRYISSLPWGSQSKIANKIGITRGYLSEFLNGKKEISRKTFQKLVNHIGIDVDEMFVISEKIDNQAEFIKEQKQLIDGIIETSRFVKKTRKINNLKVNAFAELLDISPTEYRFKESGALPFNFKELSKIFVEFDKLYPAQYDNKVLSENVGKLKDFIKNIALSEKEEQKLKMYLFKENKELLKDFMENYKYLKGGTTSEKKDDIEKVIVRKKEDKDKK